MEFEQQYNKLKDHFNSRDFIKQAEKLEAIKDNPVKLLKLYNAYFRNPYKRTDLYMREERKVRKSVRKYINEIIKEKEFGEELGGFEEVPTGENMILEKFPPLREALYQLMGKDYKAFVKDIRYIAPKPSTFQIDMGDEEFNLMWVNKEVGFTCEVAGRNYFLNTITDKQQAIKAVNSLLRVGTEIPEETPIEPGEEPSDINPSELGSGGSVGAGGDFGEPIDNEFKEVPEGEPENTDIEVVDDDDVIDDL